MLLLFDENSRYVDTGIGEINCLAKVMSYESNFQFGSRYVDENRQKIIVTCRTSDLTLSTEQQSCDVMFKSWFWKF